MLITFVEHILKLSLL